MAHIQNDKVQLITAPEQLQQKQQGWSFSPSTT